MNFAGGYYSDSNYDTDGTSFYSEYEGGGYDSEESNSPVSILSGGTNVNENNTQTTTPIIMQQGGAKYEHANYIVSLIELEKDTYEGFFEKLDNNLDKLVPNGGENQQQIKKIQSIIEKIKRNNEKYKFLFSQSPTTDIKKNFIINFHPEIIAFVTKDNANVLLNRIFNGTKSTFGTLLIMMKRIIMLTCILQLFEQIYNEFSSDIEVNDIQNLKNKINGFLSAHAGQVTNQTPNEGISDKDAKQFAAKIFKKGGMFSSISISTKEKPKIVETVKEKIAENYLDYLKTFKELYTNDFLRQHTLGFKQYKDLETLKSYTNSYGREEKIKKRFGEKLKLLFGEPTQENVKTSTEQQTVMGRAVPADQLPINSEQLTQLSKIAGNIKEKIGKNEEIIQGLVGRARYAEDKLTEYGNTYRKMDEETKVHIEVINKLTQQLQILTERQGELNSQTEANEELQKTIQELTTKNKEFQEKIDKITDDKIRAEGNRNSALAELETLKQTTSNLQQELQKLKGEKYEIDQKLTQAEAKAQNATSSTEGQREEIAKLQKQLAVKEQQIQDVSKELKAENQRIQEQVAELKTQYTTLTNEKEKIEKKLEEARNATSSSQEQTQQKSQQIAELKNQLAEQEDKIKAVSEELKTATQQIQTQEETIRTQTQTATEQAETFRELNEQIEKLTSSKNATINQLETQIDELDLALKEATEGRTTNKNEHEEKLNELQNQLKEKTKEIENLQTKNEQLSQETTTTVIELNQKLGEIAELNKTEKQRLTSELEKAQKNILELTTNNESTEREIEEKNKQLKYLKEEINNISGNVLNENLKKGNIKQQLEQQLVSLKQRNQELEQIISKEKEVGQSQAVELEELSRQLALIQSKSARKNSNNNELNEQIKQLNEQIETLKKSSSVSEKEKNLQITTLKERIDGLELEIKDKNEEIKNLENAAEQREIILKQSLEQLNKALSDSGELQSQKDSIESELTQTRQTIEQLSNSKGETLQELENRNQRLDELQSQLDKLNTELKDENTTNEKLSAELGKLTQLNKQINLEKEQISMAMENNDSRRSRNAVKISSLEKQIAELEQQLTQTGEDNINEKQKLESQIADLTKELKDAEENLESSEGNVQALGQELNNLREQLETRKQQGELDEKLVSGYEAKITDLEKQLKETQGVNSEQVKMLNAEMESLKFQLKEATNYKADLSKEMQEVAERIKQIQKEIPFRPYTIDEKSANKQLTANELFDEVKKLAHKTNEDLKVYSNEKELQDINIIDAENEDEKDEIRQILNILDGNSSGQAGGSSSAQETIQVNLKNVAKLMINLFQYMNIKTNVVYDDSIIRKIFNILSNTQDEEVKEYYGKMIIPLLTTKLSFNNDGKLIPNNDGNEGKNNNSIKSINSEINKYLNGNNFLGKLISDKIDETRSNNYNVILHNINTILIYLGNLNRKLINLKKFIESQNKDTPFIKSLDALSDSRVITYTKIRDSENSSNPRYLYAIDRDKYTSNNPGETIFTNASLDVLHANGYSQTGQGDQEETKEEILQGVSYDQYYNYGPFTKILYNTPNEDFGRKHMGNIMDKLKNGEDVFVIGYGASGAGKTTTLIYDKSNPNNHKPGAIVEMLNIARLGDISVTIDEIYINNKDKPKNIKFQKKGNDGYYNENGISLAEFLQDQIDNPAKRETKATSNNPQSSRSHIIVDINIKGGGHLFVGDFAGVENVFDYSLKENELKTFYTRVLDNLNINVSNIDIDIDNINELLRKYNFPNKTLIEFSEQKNTDEKYAYQEPITYYDNENLKIMNTYIGKYYSTSYNILNDTDFLNSIKEVINTKFVLPEIDIYKNFMPVITITSKKKLKGYTFTVKITGTIKKNEVKEDIPEHEEDFNYEVPVELSALNKSNLFKHLKIIDVKEKNYKNIEIIDVKEKNYKNIEIDEIKEYITNILKIYYNKIGNSKKSSVHSKIINQRDNANKFLQILNSRIKYIHEQAIIRSYEGLFINQTLENMRKTMTEIIKQSTYQDGILITPNFESSCIKQHCDPIMGTCFDVPIETVDINSLLTDDNIHSVINQALQGNFRKINYCLCLVVNNTPDPNPPKIPYIDLTDMKKEYDRITRFNKGEGKNGLILFRQDVDDVRSTGNPQIGLFVDAVQKKIQHHTGYEYKEWISKDIVMEKLNSTIDKIIELYGQSQYISNGQMYNINIMINSINTNKKNVTVLKLLIDIIDKNNNLTILGTLEFADQISKYNLKYERCGVDISLHRDNHNAVADFNNKKDYFHRKNNVIRLYKDKLEFDYVIPRGELTGGGNSKKYTKKIFPKLNLKKNRITIKKSC